MSLKKKEKSSVMALSGLKPLCCLFIVLNEPFDLCSCSALDKPAQSLPDSSSVHLCVPTCRRCHWCQTLTGCYPRDATYSQHLHTISGVSTSKCVPQEQVRGMLLIQGASKALRQDTCLCYDRGGYQLHVNAYAVVFLWN